MPTRTIILLSATLGIIVFIILCIIITVLVAGKVVADKHEKENKRRWLFIKNKDKKEKKEEANQ